MKQKTLEKHISFVNFKFNGKKHNLNRKWNGDKCPCECKKSMKCFVYKGDYTWNPSICACESTKECWYVKYLKNVLVKEMLLMN